MDNDSQSPRRLQGYTLLFILLLVFLALQTSGYWTTAISPVLVASRFVLGMAALMVIFQERPHRLVMGGLLLGILLAAGAEGTLGGAPGHVAAIVFHLLDTLFLGTALVWILRRLLRARSSGGADVLGAICGYLLAGEALTSLNALVYLLFPAAFHINDALTGFLGSIHGRTSVFAYYSFSQLLTLGDQNVTPVSAPATTLSLFAALFGIFYTAIVVAQFVGLEQGPRRRDPA